MSPTLFLTITVERGHDDADEVHVHPGGQGFWVARMLRELGEDVVLCCPAGGETGAVAASLLPDWGVTGKVVTTSTWSPSYVHDRRDGERVILAETTPPVLDRHSVDEFYGAALAASIEAGLCVVTGRPDGCVIDADVYRRLGADLAAVGVPVVGDLHSVELRALLEGGPVQILKVSHEELGLDESARGDEAEIWQAVDELVDAGAAAVVVSRAKEPALARFGDDRFTVVGPELSVVEHRGAGDSMTAGLSAALRMGLDPVETLQLAAAVGAANVTRHGLGSAENSLVAALVDQVVVERVS